MVTRTRNKWLRRIARWRRGPTPFKITVLLILMLISTVSSMKAGDLKNNGTIVNTGTIRVKNNAQGLPLVNTGVYEFFGGNQTIPARQYADLKISNGGVKTISSGMVAIYGTLDISPVSTLVAAPGASIDLHGTMNEQGYFQGEIDRSDNLAGISGSSTFGNIGTTISWTGTAPGNTTVLRSSGVALTSPQTGNESIKRYYDIAPTFPSNLNGTLVFKYADVELNSQDENTLSLWRSPDGGATWRKQGGVVDATLNTITKTGVVSFSRWTASDATHPLSTITSVEWIAQSLALTSGNSQSALTNATLSSPFVVTVTDAYGNPIAGTGVTFAIASTPGGASGQSLSATNVTTAANGQASTFLTLGSAAGTYTVTATSGSLAGSPVTFTATAAAVLPPPVATSMVLTAGTNQVDTVGRQLVSPLVVTVLNQFGGVISGTTVNFTVGTVPPGATGQLLTTTSVSTNGSGQASTSFRLGLKPGTYTVVATSPSLAGVVITFNFTALTGRAAILASTSGNGQTQNVKTVLAQPFVVTVTDQYANPVQGANVRFAVARTPLGASGQRLTDTSVTTGSSGQAATVMTLGDSAGVYEVTATSGSLQGSPVTFTVIATTPAAVPARIILTAGNNQVGQVNSTLPSPMIATVTDSANNPVAGVPVTFAISSAPTGATGQRLSVTSAVTDVNGQASSVLTLGSVAGSYIVTATSGSLTGSPVVFTAIATGAAVPPRIVLTAGNNQTGAVNTALQSPMVVSVLDSANNPVAGIRVTFAISSVPTGATGQRLSDTSSVTGANGQASTVLTLGNLAGAYIVTASASVAGSPIIFAATATAVSVPVATTLRITSGNNQSDTVGTRLTSPFLVTVLDQFGAPFAGATVNFSIASSPNNDPFASLSVTSARTNADGQASTVLTLGHAVGAYRVSASSGSLIGSPLTFSATAVAGRPMALAMVSGDNQSAPVKTALADPFVVAVTDTFGNPKQGVAVQFAVTEFPAGAVGQSLSNANVLTDAQGRAASVLTVGDSAGTYVVSAISVNLIGSPVRFTATAVPSGVERVATSIALTSGNAQVDTVGRRIPSPLIVTVRDQFGAPFAGATVSFAISSTPSGDTFATLSTPVVTTGTNGQAATFLTLGRKVGIYTITASSGTLAGSPITFTASAVAGRAIFVAVTSGNNQTARLSTALPDLFVVTVTDTFSNVKQGVSVQYTLTSAPTGATGHRLTDLQNVTDAVGRAAARLVLGNLAGAYEVTASFAGLEGQPAVFTATATGAAGATRIVYTSGSGQSAPILSTPTTPLTVTVFNAIGAPVQGETVIFAVDSIPLGATGQDVSLRSVTTDALGRASTSVKLGSKIGVYKFTATSAGLSGSPIAFRLTATPGPAASIVSLAGDRQVKPVMATLDSAFVVRITDAGGNPVSGMPVQFAIESAPSLATGQSLASIKPVTDMSGEASARLTLGSKAGEYVVSATVIGLPGIRFTSQAVLGAPASMALISGNNQVGYVPFELAQPFVVSIVDVGGNALPGVSVQFAIVSKPADVLGERLSVTNVTTDATGRASTILKLGDKVGVYAVQATTPSVPGLSIVFTATGTLLIGDVNSDRETNIADLTSVIDHVLGRITLSRNDSAKADMDRNGVINILDVIAIRDSLLAIAQVAAGTEDGQSSSTSDRPQMQNVSFASDTLADVKGEFVLTESGLRFNMTNKVPVKGLQLIVRLKNPVSIASPDAIYQRAQKHEFFVNTSGTEMRIVAYNAQNIPIAPDSGALFRLPLRLSDVAEIISGQVIVSKTDNVAQVDQALKGQAFKRLVDPSVDTIPYSFVLYQNYPNPFNAQTKIEYVVPDVPERTLRVLIQVFSVSGEKVKTLIASNQAAGRYSVTWDGTDDIGRKVPSGTYYYRLVSGSFQSAKKMILLK